MKKILICIICIILVVGITACGSKGGSDTPAEEGDLFTFATEDMDGNAFTSEDVKDAKIVMINFWEPWCGPCVGEMPDLEKLYEKYKDQGLVILGVFSETTMDGDAEQVLKDAGTTYPVLRYCSEFDGFQTGYVPTTVFLTGEGKLLSADPVIGSQSFEQWDNVVSELLKGLQ